MLTDSYNYELPTNLIASNPVKPRDLSNLMIVNKSKKTISHDTFYNFYKYLNKGDVLVLNQTKVIPCRIKFNLKTKKGEIFITKQHTEKTFTAMVRPGKTFKKDKEIQLFKNIKIKIKDIKEDGQRIIEILTNQSVNDLLKQYGEAPFPPYIGETKATFNQYQTVFAKQEGSLAAPTAGLHFTKKVFNKLENKGVKIVFVTLHVGLGTFLPVKSKHLEDHIMHKEMYIITPKSAKIINEAKQNNKKIVAVGTTSIRVLESNTKNGIIYPGIGDTDIFIYPGYKWKIVDSLLTNFHLPKSTLLMLVSSLAGKDLIFKAYKEAIKKHYRFYSFGDAMLIQ